MSASALNPDRARSHALEAGFSDAGVVALPHAESERDAERFEKWVQAGRAGTMGYLERRAESGGLARARIATPFPWAQSAIVCFARYDSPHPRSTAPAAPGAGWIARYAWSETSTETSANRPGEKRPRRPSDYHKVLLKRLKALEARLRAELGDGEFRNFEARAYVDTGPVVERALATAAGLGWSAKNTCLIHPKLGSFGFLAVLLTSLPVQNAKAPTAPAMQVVPDRCGTCRRCIDACPTGALTALYRMDARLCISYLTIEHKGPIEPALMEGMGRQVFGCDICQDVCPWNAKALRTAPISLSAEPGQKPDPELAPRAELVNPALEWLAAMDESEFEARFNGSPVRRAGFNGLRRNVAIAMGNSGPGRFAARLQEWSEAADEGLRAAARWALERMKATGVAE